MNRSISTASDITRNITSFFSFKPFGDTPTEKFILLLAILTEEAEILKYSS